MQLHSLQGVDYISSVDSQGLDDLTGVVNKLGDEFKGNDLGKGTKEMPEVKVVDCIFLPKRLK